MLEREGESLEKIQGNDVLRKVAPTDCRNHLSEILS